MRAPLPLLELLLTLCELASRVQGQSSRAHSHGPAHLGASTEENSLSLPPELRAGQLRAERATDERLVRAKLGRRQAPFRPPNGLPDECGEPSGQAAGQEVGAEARANPQQKATHDARACPPGQPAKNRQQSNRTPPGSGAAISPSDRFNPNRQPRPQVNLEDELPCRACDDDEGNNGNNGNINNNRNNNNNNRKTNVQTSKQADLLAKPKVIETAVFIDQALDNKFSGIGNGLVELNKLVLTIMNQVQMLFRYSSLSVPISLRLVLVEHMKESERQFNGLQAPNAENGDIDLYLANFCNWQQARLEREKRLSWDHAILLSGLDLYKGMAGKNHSGVLGLAWVGGMCKGNYSCTINEAPNFESSFVIAHELGHSLGILHDGQRDNCDPNGYIMSERTGAGKIHWSRCSNEHLRRSILRGQLKCLDSEQNGQIDSLYDLSKLRSPGQVYTINDQCRLAFGNTYSSFVTQEQPFNAVCRELWCRSGTSARAAHPALEGSSCGDAQRVCHEGKCVQP